MIREPRPFPVKTTLLAAATVLAAAFLVQHLRSRSAPPPPAPAARPARPDPVPTARADWPAGPARGNAVLAFAIVAPSPALESKVVPALIRRLAARHLPGFRVEKAAKGVAPPPPPSLVFRSAPPHRFEPRHLEFAARGLDEADRRRLARGLPAVVLMVAAPPELSHRALRGTVALVADAARAARGYVDDPEARLVFSAGAFAREVAEGGFEGEVPTVAAHVNLHTYAPEEGGGLLRSVTVGMTKLGLPDVVVNGHSRGAGPAVRTLIQAACQRLDDEPALAREGHLELDVRALRSARTRDHILESLRGGASGRADLTVARGGREEGDADNRLLELTFGGPPGGPTERQEAVLAAVLGVEERVSKVSAGDPEMLAASARARAELLALKEGYRKGLPLGSQLLVKAPFQRDRRREYMWVEVTAWEGRTLRGILQNVPEIATDLRQGAPVEVDEDGAYDYLLRGPDGAETGNHTGKVLLRREGRR